MCKLEKMNINGRSIRIATIKKACIENIIKSISKCHAIDKVVLFGSSLEERCRDTSDVDIAIFGKHSKSEMLKLKSYNDFVDSIISFGEVQDYDILYFDSRKEYDRAIMADIMAGEVLFERIPE